MSPSDLANIIMAIAAVIATTIAAYEFWFKYFRSKSQETEEAAPDNPTKD